MRKLLAGGAAIASLALAGVLASVVVGQGDDPAPLTDRPVVQGEVVPATAAQASAAGMSKAKPKRAKKKRGPKVRYYIHKDPITVQPGIAPELVALSCPGKRKVVSGYWQSSAGVVTDYFSRGNNDFKTWVYGFVNITEGPQEVLGGIVCMTKV